MKKILLSILSIVAVALVGQAQNNAAEAGRTVVMPTEKGHKIQDYGSNDTGFWNAVELYGGLSVSHSRPTIGLTELDYVAGYRFCEYFRFGIGAGARYYPKSDELRYTSWDWSFPIYANMRGNIIPRQEYRVVVPYYSVSVGCAIRDGFMVRPTIGLRISDYDRSAFIVGLSYLGQNVKIAGLDVDGTIRGKNHFASFITLNIGYEF